MFSMTPSEETAFIESVSQLFFRRQDHRFGNGLLGKARQPLRDFIFLFHKGMEYVNLVERMFRNYLDQLS